ncbi:MAG: TlpA family protein disulfide reductase [Sediminibacterium sp.]|nr:TlpA family protein disulfide reductase [Sediminibacterium sp.]
MRTILLTVLLFCFFSVSAQTAPKTRPDLASIEVKDANGAVYPTVIVQKLMATGKFGVKVAQDGKTGLLYEFSEDEINKMLAAVPKPRESNFFKTGAGISSFKESDMNGNKYNLKELAGKVVVLNFWFINCPPCRQEIPHLNEMVESYKGNNDVVFIAVALDQKYELEEFLKTTPYNYNIIDKGRYIADQYGINLYPTHVVLNKQGKVIFHTSGFGMGTVAWLKKSIESGLNATVAK